MGKFFVVMVVCIVLTIILFFVMIYLMTTVDPPKLKRMPYSVDLNLVDKPITGDRRYDNMFYNDGLLPFMDVAQYGLERAEIDAIDFYHSTYKPGFNRPNVTSFSPRKVVPPLWPRATRTVIIDPTIPAIVPLIWPIIEKAMKPSMTSTMTTESSDFRYGMQNHEEESPINKTSVKPMKRRSVSNYKKDDNSGSIILKILDNVGHSRIEIKLSTDEKNLSKRKPKGSRSFMNQKSKFTMLTDSNDAPIEAEGLKATIVKILPNDSAIVDEFESKLFSDKDISDLTNITFLLSSLLADSTKDININNKADTEENVLEKKMENRNINIIGDQLYDDISVKVFNENATKSFKIDLENSKYFVNSNDSTIFVLSNNTEFDNLADMKLNNTEFNKIVFEDEETTYVTNDATVQSVAESFAVVSNHTDPSNYTDMLIKN